MGSVIKPKSTEERNSPTRKHTRATRSLIEISVDSEITSLVRLNDEDDDKWDASFAESPDVLEELAAEASREYKAGKTKPLQFKSSK